MARPVQMIKVCFLQLGQAVTTSRMKMIAQPTHLLMQFCGTSGTSCSACSWNRRGTCGQGLQNSFFLNTSRFSLSMPSTSDIFQHYPWQVRPVSIFFDPASVYGTREGYHSGLLVTSSDRTNYFTKSPVYKSGVVHGVGMLPRLLGCVFFHCFFSGPTQSGLFLESSSPNKVR